MKKKKLANLIMVLITPGEEGNVCTITIVCDTILDNLDNLDEEKVPYVPENGDEIVWCYTCNGLGADVGEVWMGDE